MIARVAKAPRQKPDVVATKVVQKGGRDLDFARGLGVGFGDGSLDGAGEEVGYFGLG